MRSKFGKVKDVKPVDLAKEKQAEVKQRLLESKLQKQIINLARGFWELLKTIGIKFWNLRRQTKIKILGRRAMWQKDKMIRDVDKESVDNSLTAAKIAEAEKLIKNKQWDEAEGKLIETLTLDPKNVRAYMALGEVYTKLSDYETAEEAYRYIAKLDKNFLGGYQALMANFAKTKNWHKIIDLCQEVLALDKNEVWLQVHMGVAYKKIGFPEKAEGCFKAAVEKEPQNEGLLDYLIEVAIINKNKPLAEKAWNTLGNISHDVVKLQGYRNKIDLL